VFILIVLINSILSSVGLLIKIGLIGGLVYGSSKTYKSIKDSLTRKRRKPDYSIDEHKLSSSQIDEEIDPKNW
jgi:hypothetical protein